LIIIIQKIIKKLKFILFRKISRKIQTINRIFDRLKWNNLNRFDSEYYSRRSYGKWLDDEQKIVDVLMDMFNPSSVLDLGCGNGIYLKLFNDKGVKDFLGYDGSDIAVKEAVIRNVLKADLREEIDARKYFDMILCIEVAPYISDAYEQNLINSILNQSRAGSIVIFIASDKYTGGQYHVNLKSHKDWKKLFNQSGFSFCPKETSKVQELINLEQLVWIQDNLLIFRRI